MTPLNRDKIILAKTGWCERYEGLGQGDDPRGNFAGLRGGGAGHESFNFKRTSDGRYFGYFRANKGRLRLERIDNLTTGPQVGGVLVVWVSVPPGEQGLRVVGWYRNATVFDGERTEDDPWTDDRYADRTNPEGRCSYICIAPPEGAFLLPVEQRANWRLPAAVTDRMHRTNVLHPHVGYSTERTRWVAEMKDLLDRIENIKTVSNSGDASGASSG